MNFLKSAFLVCALFLCLSAGQAHACLFYTSRRWRERQRLPDIISKYICFNFIVKFLRRPREWKLSLIHI